MNHNEIPKIQSRHLYGDHTHPSGSRIKGGCYDVHMQDGSVLHVKMDEDTARAIQSFIVLCNGVAPVKMEEANMPNYQRL